MTYRRNNKYDLWDKITDFGNAVYNPVVTFFSNNLIAELAIKALILPGQNNHCWEMSASILKDALEKTGLFQVDVLQSSPQGRDFPRFNLNLRIIRW